MSTTCKICLSEEAINPKSSYPICGTCAVDFYETAMKKSRYVVVVTIKGNYDCILDCGVMSLFDAEEAIKKAEAEDEKWGWLYQYKLVLVKVRKS